MGRGKRMITKKKAGKGENILISAVLKSILGAYLITFLLLLLLTVLVYRFHIPEGAVQGGICLIYVLAGMLGGVIAGKKAVSRRFLWGLLAGGVYFAILVVVSLVAGHPVVDQMGRFLFVLLLCAVSGMLGGMLS